MGFWCICKQLWSASYTPNHARKYPGVHGRAVLAVPVQEDTHQVGHDNGVHDDRAAGGAQGELQAPGWLPSGNVIAVPLQQQVLQLILCSHNTLHLKGADTADCSTSSEVTDFIL